MKRFCLIISLLLFFFISYAQEEEPQTEGKIFDFGVTVGFNSTFPVINSITIDDIKLENILHQYKVGYLASVFCRININRFFLQPSFVIDRSESDILFNVPSGIELPLLPEESSELLNARIAMEKLSFQIPVLIGYNIIKQNYYALSLMAGPNFTYNYKVTYSSESTNNSHEYVSESTPWGVSLGMGVAVRIWQLFFDFRYDFGLNQVESDFRSKDPSIPVISNNVRIDKRTNVMSFSLGIVF